MRGTQGELCHRRLIAYPRGQGFDETWRAEVEAEFARFADLAGEESGVLDDPITETEVEAAIRSAKLYKAGVRSDPLVNAIMKFGVGAVRAALVAQSKKKKKNKKI